MKIRVDGQPIAGERLGIDVDDNDPVQIEVFSDSRLIWRHECPDPPCHEQFLIPSDHAGRTLQIASRSPSSQEWRSLELNILPPRKLVR